MGVRTSQETTCALIDPKVASDEFGRYSLIAYRHVVPFSAVLSKENSCSIHVGIGRAVVERQERQGRGGDARFNHM